MSMRKKLRMLVKRKLLLGHLLVPIPCKNNQSTTDHADIDISAYTIIYILFISSSTIVVVKEADTKQLMDECEISKDAAESLLRKSNGDIALAIKEYIHGN